ncbi:hypothetical protein GGR91_001071 [Sphingorhabdus rigui]|uniref:Uncharacterized protein n=1 Tax=Sphingorhabdus rigui TaxID=1282858 RepID=A0A840AWY2_9SPHN|nr:hypothetical protein [Sphingorhabdus rigui]MBB3942849.1 hypothetical protein [Sphingorhabdus rigui]
MMTVVFSLIFLVAMVGVFRPYKFLQQGKRWHYGLAAFASFIAVGLFAPEQSGDSATDAKIGVPTDKISNSIKAGVADAEALKSKWDYNTQKDEMRGSEAHFATLNSENTIKFDFPYGEQPGILTVRRDPQHGLDLIFSVPSGQILCSGFGDDYINAKFDDGPIRRFSCSGASDGSSEVSFIGSPKKFLGELKRAKRTVIEAEFYQAGRQQYIFETQNLIWEK